MKVGEIIKQLVTAPSYLDVRITVDDSVINFIREYMERDYELFKEKEEAYQEVLKMLQN